MDKVYDFCLLVLATVSYLAGYLLCGFVLYASFLLVWEGSKPLLYTYLGLLSLLGLLTPVYVGIYLIRSKKSKGSKLNRGNP